MSKILVPVLSFFILAGAVSFASAGVVNTIADAAGDYVTAAGGPSNVLTTFPPGWSYLTSSTLPGGGGTEITLTAGSVGNTGEQGFNLSGALLNVSAVTGTNSTGGDFEILGNGQANNAVVGTDLLLHPAQNTAVGNFVIARYTVSQADVTNQVAGSGTIAGNFRNLVTGGGAADESITADVFINNTSLFSVTGGLNGDFGTSDILTQADGTFNLTGFTFAAGDTIDFIVGANGAFDADETALNAIIQVETSAVPEPSTIAILGLGCIGFVFRRRR